MSATYIIAEVGNTHEGSLGLAKRFIRAAADCGVDAVKFQTHIFSAESLPNAPNPPYFKDETREEYFERTAFNLEQYQELRRYCEEECGCDFLSSPFSLEAIDLLEELDIKAYKVPSGEVTNIPFLVKLARTGKRVILSSGMSSWAELDQAVSVLRENGCEDLIVLQCTSEYPCPAEETGLNAMLEMKERYNCPVGFSDHTIGNAVPIAAVVMGASLVEKHFTLSKLMYGSDASNSTEPDEFKRLVTEIRDVEKAMNSRVDKDEKVKALGHMKITFEKSIVAARNLQSDTVITEGDLAYKKPGDGVPASRYREILGKTLKVDLEKDQKIELNQFHGNEA